MFYGSALTVFPVMVHGDQLIDVGFPYSIQAGFRCLLFRKPPAMGCHDHPFRNHGCQFCLVSGSTYPVLYPHPLAIADAVAGSGFRMDLHQRIWINLPQPWDIAMFRVEECRRPPSCGKDQGVLFGQVRPADRCKGRLFVVGNRLQVPLFPEGGIEFKKACLGPESRFFIRPVPTLNTMLSGPCSSLILFIFSSIRS